MPYLVVLLLSLLIPSGVGASELPQQLLDSVDAIYEGIPSSYDKLRRSGRGSYVPTDFINYRKLVENLSSRYIRQMNREKANSELLTGMSDAELELGIIDQIKNQFGLIYISNGAQVYYELKKKNGRILSCDIPDYFTYRSGIQLAMCISEFNDHGLVVKYLEKDQPERTVLWVFTKENAVARLTDIQFELPANGWAYLIGAK